MQRDYLVELEECHSGCGVTIYDKNLIGIEIGEDSTGILFSTYKHGKTIVAKMVAKMTVMEKALEFMSNDKCYSYDVKGKTRHHKSSILNQWK